MEQNRNKFQGLKQTTLVLIWLFAVLMGFGKLVLYSNTPGPAISAPASWPSHTKIQRSQDLPTYMVFVHPYCPCSEATIGELERLMPAIINKAKVIVVFFRPTNKSEQWVRGKLWSRSTDIPGTTSVIDSGGTEAQAFNAKTSGQTFLYDKGGQLLFSGGITSQRGHMGDSVGRNLIISYFKTGEIGIHKSPVFGCSLRNPERAPSGVTL